MEKIVNNLIGYKDIVVVKVIGDEVFNSKRNSTIIIPENTRLPQSIGEVVVFGDKVKGLKKGEYIIFHRSGGQVMLFGSQEYRALKDVEIFCKISSENFIEDLK